MSDEKLFNGVGMIIDDHVYDAQKNVDSVVKLVDYLENERKIPLVKYKSLPDLSDLNVISSIKFILLDWDLVGLTDESGFGIGIPSNLKEDTIKESLDFLKKIKESAVVPIFIFSNNDVNDIQERLKDNGLWTDEDDGSSHIFIKSKSDLFDDKGQCVMFDVINGWLQKRPSLYVVQKWNAVYSQAMNSMALNMNGASAYWPNILWRCYKDDGVNPSDEIVSIINQNVLSRIQPVNFNEQILNEEKECSQDVLKDVLGKHCFIENYYLTEASSTGDVYFDKKKYYINIRPMCDCVNRKGIDKIYLLEGGKLSNSRTKNNYSSTYGKFDERTNSVIIGPINGKFVEFKFKELQIAEYEEWKSKRIGRVIPPYITYIAQKYGLYIHRQGLPRIPKEIIPDMPEDVKVGTENLQQELLDCRKQIEKLTAKLRAKEHSVNGQQPVYHLHNCKVFVVPKLKKRKFRR